MITTLTLSRSSPARPPRLDGATWPGGALPLPWAVLAVLATLGLGGWLASPSQGALLEVALLAGLGAASRDEPGDAAGLGDDLTTLSMAAFATLGVFKLLG